jgi:Cd2+/Zn2+-exporting ATPase
MIFRVCARNAGMSQSTSQHEAEPLVVKIAGMDCGSCALTIENSIRKLPGVEQADVSFTTETMEVAGNVSLDGRQRQPGRDRGTPE